MVVVPVDVSRAAIDGQLGPVRGWFESGDRNANDFDQHGFTLLYRVFQRGVAAPTRNQLVRYLVARGADVNLPMFTHDPKYTYLHQGMEAWDSERVDILLELGADVAAKDGRGRTPLESALCQPYLHSALVSCCFNVAILHKMLREGASLEFLVHDVSPEGYLRALIEGVPNLDIRLSDDDVAEGVREINAGIDLISAVREDGSYRAYLRRPHKALLRIRSLRARRRANPDATPPHIARLLDPAFPREIAWGILTYWLDAG